ncbi:MAG TPA: hypothetical protein VN737_18700 [Bryobacteraceae bacterium]|jgi:hypothetical protein|nr:hypothetical protein [Bryobacteraceae bacterium]
MRRYLSLAVMAAGLLFILAPSMKADEWNKMTRISVNQPVDLQNVALSPGHYVLKLMDSPSDRFVVQVFSADQQHLITTILAIPAFRMNPASKTKFGFYESAPGHPMAVRTWFYPGDNFGFQFNPPPNLTGNASVSQSHPTSPVSAMGE